MAVSRTLGGGGGSEDPGPFCNEVHVSWCILTGHPLLYMPIKHIERTSCSEFCDP